MRYSDPSGLVAKPRWLLQSVADVGRHEGFREYAYPDPESYIGKRYPSSKYGWGSKPARIILASLGLDASKGTPWTVGHGFIHGVTPDTRISLEQSFKRLEVEVIQHARGLDDLFPGWRDRPLFLQTVLVDMIYNLGKAGLGGFKNTLRYMKEANYPQAATNMERSLWYRQTGSRAREDVARIRNQSIEPEHIVKL